MTEAKQKAKKQAEAAIAKVRDIAEETTAAAEETAKPQNPKAPKPQNPSAYQQVRIESYK